jgi:hypothetical protein
VLISVSVADALRSARDERDAGLSRRVVSSDEPRGADVGERFCWPELEDLERVLWKETRELEVVGRGDG